MSQYILVADEMGTPGMAPGTSNSFVFGGYVVRERELVRAIEAWRKIRLEMCGSTEVELKWKHFFVDANDPKTGCPLLVKNPLARRNLAALALDYLFRNASLIPDGMVSTFGFSQSFSEYPKEEDTNGWKIIWQKGGHDRGQQVRGY